MGLGMFLAIEVKLRGSVNISMKLTLLVVLYRW